jgi:putative aldouronate transport system substrate-binding protein
MDKAGYAVEDIKTLEQWKDAIVDIAASDPDGNGKDDTLGYAAFSYNLGDGYMTDNMCSAFGAYDGQKDADGGLFYWGMTDGWVDYIKFANEMYADGAVSKEFSVLSVSEASDMFKAGLAVSYIRTGTWGWGYEDYDVAKMLNFYEGTCNEEWHTYAFYGIEGRDYEVNDEGVKVATDYGKDNVNKYQFLQQVTTTIANTEMKLVSTSAPKSFNDKIKENALTYLEPEANIKLNHFRAIKSDSWATVWPLYQSTYEENTVKTIVGQMSIEDYKAYIEELRAQDDMKTCWQEFAANDAVLFPGGY